MAKILNKENIHNADYVSFKSGFSLP